MKLKITRSELKEIFEIACVGWKPKIEKFAGRNLFEDEIEFSAKEIEEMISASTKEQLPTVKRIFDVVDTFESIEDVESACKYLGELEDDVRQLRLLQNIPKLNRRTLAGQELIVITKALNEGTVLDWDDSNEYKYIPWWYLGKKFRFCRVNAYCSNSFVCAPLYLKSRELAEYSANKFFSIWKDYLN